MPNLKYTPEWKKYEADLKSEDRETSLKASEKFEAERNHQMKVDAKARRWETSRKEHLAKLKPQWAKKVVANPSDPLDKLKKFGAYKYDLAPTRGYLLVLPDKQEQTQSGIILKVDEEPNTGRVVRTGDPVRISEKFAIDAPCSAGDLILFKRGAGVEMKIKDNNCRLMQFSDVLGIFEEEVTSDSSKGCDQDDKS
jgi:co-chaperonin GroES (HSP10)